MVLTIVVVFVNLFANVFYVLILGRVLLSWFVPPTNGLLAWLVGVTEPLLAPIRKLIPATPGVDVAPLVAFVLLQLVKLAAAQLPAVPISSI